MTLVTVTKPSNAKELEACVISARNHERNTHQAEWLIITEQANVKAVEQIVPFERVLAMEELNPRIMDIGDGWLRQQAAKLSVSELTDSVIVYLDDEVITNQPWSEDTFLDGNGNVTIYFESTAAHPFQAGQISIFGEMVARNYLIGLPFAYTTAALDRMRGSKEYARTMELLEKGVRSISEFNLMAEYEWRNGDGEGVGFRNRLVARNHWTKDLAIFTDWQGRRKDLRLELTLIQP
jgi:hypothetical protein